MMMASSSNIELCMLYLGPPLFTDANIHAVLGLSGAPLRQGKYKITLLSLMKRLVTNSYEKTHSYNKDE